MGDVEELDIDIEFINIDLARKHMKSLLVYYGYLNSFNSGTNAWDNMNVAKDLAQYHLMVFGDGVQDPAHPDYSNTEVIIPKIKELNQTCKIYGYVDTAITYASFTSKVDQWASLGVNGIMMDQAGYDFGTVATNGRTAFNSKVDYCHNNDLYVMANAWNPKHILSNDAGDDDVSYPNATWNADALDSSLMHFDWFMLESFAIDSSGNYESASQWYDRGQNIQNYHIQKCAISVIPNTGGTQAQFDFIYNSALAFDLDAVGSSDTSYAASSAAVTKWTMPSDSAKLRTLSNPVVVDPKDSNKYLQYFDNGKIEMDFTSSSESTTTTIY